MGKSRKSRVTQRLTQPSLADQIQSEKEIKPSARIKQRIRKDDETEFVEPSISRAILRVAQEQQAEIAREEGTSSRLIFKKPDAFDAFNELAEATDDDDDTASEVGSLPDMDNIRISEEDENAFRFFMAKEPPLRRTLADIIMEKLAEKKGEIDLELADDKARLEKNLDPRIVKMFRGVGDVLRTYRSGKLPKAFKVIPKLSNWEQILALTNPDRWTAAAMYQATRIFASNLHERMAQRFYNLILLPRVRDDIAEYKKLNFHLYQALRKALFKPGAFFRGILLPLCDGGDCTLREAIIIGSVLTRNSIPVIHAAAAMNKIAEMDYSGANSIFLRILFDKKYALPYRVIDSVVAHFLRFTMDDRILPVLWHQALLTFVQTYKEDLSSEQKEAIMDLVKKHCHYQIGPEIRRELIRSKCRDLESFEYAEDAVMT